MGSGKEFGFLLFATETFGNFNQECDMIWFTSLKDYLVYSMEKGIAVVRIGEKEREGRKHFF